MPDFIAEIKLTELESIRERFRAIEKRIAALEEWKERQEKPIKKEDLMRICAILRERTQAEPYLNEIKSRQDQLNQEFPKTLL